MIIVLTLGLISAVATATQILSLKETLLGYHWVMWWHIEWSCIQDGSVGVAGLGCGLYLRRIVFRFQASVRHSLTQSFQDRPWAHPATCSMDTGGFKQTTHLHLSVGLKNEWNYTSFPPHAFMFMWYKWVKWTCGFRVLLFANRIFLLKVSYRVFLIFSTLLFLRVGVCLDCKYVQIYGTSKVPCGKHMLWMKSAVRNEVDDVVLFARLALQVLKEKLSARRREGRNVVSVCF